MRARVTPRVVVYSVTLAVLVWADRAVAESAARGALDVIDDGLFLTILAAFAILFAAVWICDVLRARRG